MNKPCEIRMHFNQARRCDIVIEATECEIEYLFEEIDVQLYRGH